MLLQKNNESNSKTKSVIERIYTLRFKDWTIPFALLVLCILSYGLLLPLLGFYWDDWETILITKLFPGSQFWSYFAGPRPFAAWTYVIFSPLLGTRPIVWQTFTLLLHWLTALTFLWSLVRLWPAAKRQSFYIASLFAVYPLFKLQFISVAFHQHWLGYLLFFISIGMMIQSIRKPERYWQYTALSIFALLMNLSIFEYFIGVELIRPVIIWILLQESTSTRKRKILQVLRLWIPYLIIFLLFMGWRIERSIRMPNLPDKPLLLFDLLVRPISVTRRLMELSVRDTIQVLAQDWFDTFAPSLIDFINPSRLASLGLAAVTGFIYAVFVYRLDVNGTDDKKHGVQWEKQALILGMCALLLGGVPIWITGRSVIGSIFSSRFGMTMMIGASLILVALIQWFVKDRLKMALIIGIMVGLGAGSHFRVANDFKRSWSKQLAFYWQLYWRAPFIQPQTTFLADGDLFPYVRPTFSINTLYSQPEETNELSYWFYLLDREVSTSQLLVPEGIRFQEEYRGFTFYGDSRDSLVLHYDPPNTNCLWVLSPEDRDDPVLTDTTRSTVEISDLERIRLDTPQTAIPPQTIFGFRDENVWCYYYEKAELARQFQQWSEIVTLGVRAEEQGYRPENTGQNSPHEWLPFIEGYARSGSLDDALELSKKIVEVNKSYEDMICNIWVRIMEEQPMTLAQVDQILVNVSGSGCDP